MPDCHSLSAKFDSASEGKSLLRAGWSKPEASETWSVSARPTLALPPPSHPATYVLVIRMRPFVVEGRLPLQHLRVLTGGIEIGRFALSCRCVRACLIPWHLLAGRSEIDIQFELPDAASPSDNGIGHDGRQLGIALTEIELYAGRYEAWPPDASSLEDAPVPIDMSVIAAVDAMPPGELMMQFESLGQNCEFGLVQRTAGVEPLGLLRFSSTPLPKLLTALEARFSGLGAPGTIKASLSPNGRELMVQDTVFGFLYHAWVGAGEMTPEEVEAREVRRVPFLVRKLLEELEASEKTFIYKGMGAMRQEEVFPLAMALRRYGPNTLLFVNLADAEHRAGTVEAVAPGFLVGYLDRFAPTEKAEGFLLDQWVRVCRETCRLRLVAAAINR